MKSKLDDLNLEQFLEYVNNFEESYPEVDEYFKKLELEKWNQN